MENRIASRNDVHYIGVVTDKAKPARAGDVTVRLTRFVVKGIVTDIAFKPLELVDASPVAEDAPGYDRVCAGSARKTTRKLGAERCRPIRGVDWRCGWVQRWSGGCAGTVRRRSGHNQSCTVTAGGK